jgi:hypothetical protein
MPSITLHGQRSTFEPDNRWLREVMEEQLPVIYFLDTSGATDLA